MIISINKRIHNYFIKKFFDNNRIHKKGDYNLFGSEKKVVHGINIVLHTIDILAQKKIININNKCFLEIFFKYPIFVNEKLNIKIKKYKEFFHIILKNNVKIKCEIKFYFSNKKLNKFIFLKKNNQNYLKNFKNIKKNNYNEFLSLIDKKNLTLFKTLKKNWGEDRINSILNFSFLVGKIYPGENSLFLSCKIFFNNIPRENIKFKINNFDKRFNISNINIIGSGVTSNIDAHHINRNFDEYSILQKDLKKIKKEKKLKKKYLILGGSSGIGLALSYLILKMGGNVTASYNKNIKNLILLKKKYPNKLKIINIKLNNFNKNKLMKLINFQNYNYIFYFISPKIFIEKTKKWDKKLFNNFLKFYVKFPQQIINEIKSNQTFFSPSTIAIGKNIIDLNEYTKAKSIMEKKFLKIIKLKKKKILFYRLNEIENNQTIGNFLSFKKTLANTALEILNKVLKN